MWNNTDFNIIFCIITQALQYKVPKNMSSLSSHINILCKQQIFVTVDIWDKVKSTKYYVY